MSSKKCPNCGLVNFATSEECKRCNHSLNKLDSIASDRSYQKTKSTKNYEFSCVMCGCTNDLSMLEIEQDFVPAVASVGKLFGLHGLASQATITHKGRVPFCDKCWWKYEKTGLFRRLGIVGGAGVLVIGLFTLISYDSVEPVTVSNVVLGLVFFAIVAIVVSLAGFVFTWLNTPKIKLINREHCVIESYRGENFIVGD